MYEHRKTPPSAPGLSHDNSKTLKIRVPPGEPDGAFARLDVEKPHLLYGAHVSRAWLLDLHDRIGRLLNWPSVRQVGALRLAAEHVLFVSDYPSEVGKEREEEVLDELNAALDDMP